jgi:hypothetical protein
MHVISQLSSALLDAPSAEYIQVQVGPNLEKCNFKIIAWTTCSFTTQTLHKDCYLPFYLTVKCIRISPN